MSAVWRYSQAPDMGSLLILLALADWSDDEGFCFPSHRAICEKTGGSPSTVKRHLRELIRRGELERVSTQGHTTPTHREFIGRTGFKPTNLYRVTLVDQLGSKRPEFLERNRVRKTPVPAVGDGPNGGHGDRLTGVRADRQRGSGVFALRDPSEDTSEKIPPGPPSGGREEKRRVRVRAADRRRIAENEAFGGPGLSLIHI